MIFKEELTPARGGQGALRGGADHDRGAGDDPGGGHPAGNAVHAALHRTASITLYVANINVGVLYLTAIASISVYGIVLAGWASNNKYAMLGGMRSTAQMISYELALGLCFVVAILLGNSMNLVDIVEAQKGMWFVVLQPVGALVFMVTTLAEVNRAPFDMPEAEQELAAGYHSEYSGMKFALFFMAEYEKMIVISMIAATLFFGGYREFWFLKDTFLSVDQHLVAGPVLPAGQSGRAACSS